METSQIAPESQFTAPAETQVPAPDAPIEPVDFDAGRILDKDKAEVMAYASKPEEEAVVSARNAALEAASNIGNDGFRSSENRGAAHEARVQAGMAQEARERADSLAQNAADVYDQVKGL